MLALVILAVPLEHTYGPLRIFAIFLSAGDTAMYMIRANQHLLHAHFTPSRDISQEVQRSCSPVCIACWLETLMICMR
jgi:hypothetical protein